MKIVLRKPLTDEQIDLIVQKVINRLFLRRWEQYLKSGWREDAKRIATGDNNGRFPGMKLIRAVTPRQDELLRLLKPDGSPDWHLNKDFLKFAEKTDELGFLKQFPLNSVDPEKLIHKPSKASGDNHAPLRTPEK